MERYNYVPTYQNIDTNPMYKNLQIGPLFSVFFVWYMMFACQVLLYVSMYGESSSLYHDMQWNLKKWTHQWHNLLWVCQWLPLEQHHIIVSQITGKLTIWSKGCPGWQQRKHQSLVRGIPHWPVDSPHKGPAMWKAFQCHDIIISMLWCQWYCSNR